jgi:cytochrome c nitrite reductase small subunit
VKLLLALLIGMLAGVGGYTFWYARGYSYLLDDPNACVNCHIMREPYDHWSRASHKHVATCNDCHTPHQFIGKWTTKVINGWNHSYAFTFDAYPDPIVITPRNARIVRQACLKCHSQLVAEILPSHAMATKPLDCVQCHRTVGHGP